ncbi:MAG: FixH family protein [Burkholderiaceae bacterium]
MAVSRSAVGLFAAGVASVAMAADDGNSESRRAVRQGLVVEFSAERVDAPGPLMEDSFADVRFRITDEATGKPVQRLSPGAWLDMGDSLHERQGAEQKSCKEKIGLYLKGIVGIRPMIDMNSYYVVVMNRDASVSIMDPTVSMAGRTSTLAQIRLPRPGSDWSRSSDGRRLFVAMPEADKIAVIQTETFKLGEVVPAGASPTRIVTQPDGRYLWVGNDPRNASGGVTVIDAESLKTVASFPTGRGHHEIALSSDSRYALITNREDGTVSLVDVRALKLARTFKLGTVPMSVAYSTLSKAFYVADGKAGTVHVFRPDAQKDERRIALKSGIGPMKFTPDGRFLLALNTPEDLVHVIDAATNTAVNAIPVQAQPYQVEFTREYAYVRSLGSERVSMINLGTLGRGKTPRVQSFAAGAAPPKAAGSLVLASSMAPAAGEAGVLVVNPADNTTYFYMEGMNATSSNYQAYGSSARAVTVVDRSLKEIEPGVYGATVKLPAAGRYDVAFSLDSPALLHCFSATVAENAELAKGRQGVELQYLFEKREVPAESTAPFRFRFVDKATGRPVTGLTDARVMFYRVPGLDRGEVTATEIGDGVYEAQVKFAGSGAYYVYVSSVTLKKAFRDLPFYSLVATAPKNPVR